MAQVSANEAMHRELQALRARADGARLFATPHEYPWLAMLLSNANSRRLPTAELRRTSAEMRAMTREDRFDVIVQLEKELVSTSQFVPTNAVDALRHENAVFTLAARATRDVDRYNTHLRAKALMSKVMGYHASWSRGMAWYSAGSLSISRNGFGSRVQWFVAFLRGTFSASPLLQLERVQFDRELLRQLEASDIGWDTTIHHLVPVVSTVRYLALAVAWIELYGESLLASPLFVDLMQDQPPSLMYSGPLVRGAGTGLAERVLRILRRSDTTPEINPLQVVQELGLDTLIQAGILHSALEHGISWPTDHGDPRFNILNRIQTRSPLEEMLSNFDAPLANLHEVVRRLVWMHTRYRRASRPVDPAVVVLRSLKLIETRGLDHAVNVLKLPWAAAAAEAAAPLATEAAAPSDSDEKEEDEADVTREKEEDEADVTREKEKEATEAKARRHAILDEMARQVTNLNATNKQMARHPRLSFGPRGVEEDEEAGASSSSSSSSDPKRQRRGPRARTDHSLPPGVDKLVRQFASGCRR